MGKCIRQLFRERGKIRRIELASGKENELLSQTGRKGDVILVTGKSISNF
jgi:hypothetical protein